MSLQSFVDVISLVAKAPRSQIEIREITGYKEAIVRKYIHLMHQEGLIERDAPRFDAATRRRHTVWRWVHGLKDDGTPKTYAPPMTSVARTTA
jgi:DNA-binding MarR family transcriptional regulator